jgi:uncharacterized protein (DUF58 family)
MIVPRSRLIFWVIAFIFPFSIVAALIPAASSISVVCIATLAIVAIGDALSAPGRLEGISVELPPVVRMSKDREGKLEVRIGNKPARRKLLRIALSLPREIRADSEELDVILPEQAEWAHFLWKCAPSKRGNYRIDSAYLETASVAGFWSARKVVAVNAEIRVYPDLLRERKSLASLFLKRGSLGQHLQRQIGKGRDFEKLREYTPGDSFDEIHWKATARRARPITKVFQIERTQEIYVVVDASRLSARETAQGSSTLERQLTAALVLGLATEQQGDLFGLITFTDKVDTFVRAGCGNAHYSVCRDALYTVQARTVTPDFNELSTFIRLRLRRRALIIILTSLDDPAIADSFVRNVELIRRQHVVMVNMIRQSTTMPMFTARDVQSVDDLYRQIGSHIRWERLQQLEKTLRRRGVAFSMMENERASSELVSRYLGVKQRQLL